MADSLCEASARGNLSEVSLLLQDGANVNGFNMYNRTALQVSINRLVCVKVNLEEQFCSCSFGRL